MTCCRHSERIITLRLRRWRCLERLFDCDCDCDAELTGFLVIFPVREPAGGRYGAFSICQITRDYSSVKLPDGIGIVQPLALAIATGGGGNQATYARQPSTYQGGGGDYGIT